MITVQGSKHVHFIIPWTRHDMKVWSLCWTLWIPDVFLSPSYSINDVFKCQVFCVFFVCLFFLIQTFLSFCGTANSVYWMSNINIYTFSLKHFYRFHWPIVLSPFKISVKVMFGQAMLFPNTFFQVFLPNSLLTPVWCPVILNRLFVTPEGIGLVPPPNQCHVKWDQLPCGKILD